MSRLREAQNRRPGVIYRPFYKRTTGVEPATFGLGSPPSGCDSRLWSAVGLCQVVPRWVRSAQFGTRFRRYAVSAQD